MGRPENPLAGHPGPMACKKGNLPGAWCFAIQTLNIALLFNQKRGGKPQKLLLSSAG